MKWTKSRIFTLILVLFAVCVHFYANDSTRVENSYSTGFYPFFSRILRYLLGWLPFSIGDILYALAICWLIGKLYRGIKILLKKQVSWNGFITGSFQAFHILLVVYIIFNLFWGINYNRKGIAEQLGLTMNTYKTEDLKMINAVLLQKVNASKEVLVQQRAVYPSKKQLFSRVEAAYWEIAKTYPFLQYKPGSIKPSVWSWVGNYMGFTGYYNPFTGEAQVNTLVPKFLQPFTTCHEAAHQLGYAKEMEANFVGYLAAAASKDTLLHYSVYLDLFMYSNRNLFTADSAAANAFRAQLSPAVISDLRTWREFYKQHKNPVEPVFRWVYGKYLEQNQQPQGVLSYDAVTGFIIAYYKKFGNI